MQTMRCAHCDGEVAYGPQNDGQAFDCPSCGRPGVYGFALNPASRTAASPGPSPVATSSPAKRSSVGGVVKVVGGGAIGAAAIFGIVGKGAKQAPKLLKPAVTRSLPTQIPSKFTASPYRAPLGAPAGASTAGSGFSSVPAVAPAASSGSTYIPLHAGAHGVRALTQPSRDDRQPAPALPPNVPGALPGDAGR